MNEPQTETELLEQRLRDAAQTPMRDFSTLKLKVLQSLPASEANSLSSGVLSDGAFSSGVDDGRRPNLHWRHFVGIAAMVTLAFFAGRFTAMPIIVESSPAILPLPTNSEVVLQQAVRENLKQKESLLAQEETHEKQPVEIVKIDIEGNRSESDIFVQIRKRQDRRQKLLDELQEVF